MLAARRLGRSNDAWPRAHETHGHHMAPIDGRPKARGTSPHECAAIAAQLETLEWLRVPLLIIGRYEDDMEEVIVQLIAFSAELPKHLSLTVECGRHIVRRSIVVGGH
jgi:hypothetical protein